MDVLITGYLKTVTPLTYTSPDTEGLPKIGGQVYLPSSAIRGKLRRMARNAVIEETGKKMDFTDFFFLSVGGLNNAGKAKAEAEPEGDGDGKEVSLKEAKESYAVQVLQTADRYNPLISLFGAGPGSPVAIPSKLSINHAFAPQTVGSREPNPVSKVSPCRTDDVRVSPADTQELISDAFFDEYLAQVVGQRAGAALKNKINELKKLRRKEGADKDAINAEIKEIEAKLKEKPVSISNPGLAYEVINPGVTMETNMRVIRANEREMALLMRAFERLACEPVFGGKKSAGNGLVSGSFKISVREGRTGGFREAGHIEWSGDYSGLTRIEGLAKDWLELQLPYDELKFDYKTLAAAAA